MFVHLYWYEIAYVKFGGGREISLPSGVIVQVRDRRFSGLLGHKLVVVASDFPGGLLRRGMPEEVKGVRLVVDEDGVIGITRDD